MPTLSGIERVSFSSNPYGMRLKPEGLSHGLKTVRRTVSTAAYAAAALSGPARSIKKPDTPTGIWFLVHRNTQYPKQ